MKRSGFTLLELIITIGIIATLMAVLIPTTQKVRQQARKSICASNLRQIGQSLLLYVQDHKNRLPYVLEPMWKPGQPVDLTVDPRNYPQSFLRVMEPYGVNESLMTCPSYVLKLPNWDEPVQTYRVSSANNADGGTTHDPTNAPPGENGGLQIQSQVSERSTLQSRSRDARAHPGRGPGRSAPTRGRTVLFGPGFRPQKHGGVYHRLYLAAQQSVQSAQNRHERVVGKESDTDFLFPLIFFRRLVLSNRQRPLRCRATAARNAWMSMNFPGQSVDLPVMECPRMFVVGMRYSSAR
ncbi:MAG: hypothetical protein KatS3mg104_2573 [Phycisphaerae bacterium]|nr:MAG: hypothetical protein KatS3mg104_2573 [Phycisphaerae bacterium]